MNTHRKTAIITGAGVIGAFLLMIIVVGIVSTRKSLEDGFRVHVRFRYVNNLVEGAIVYLDGGSKAGYVDKIWQENMKTYVTVYLRGELRNKIPLAQDTYFAIFSDTFFGQKYVNLSFDKTLKDFIPLKDGSTIDGMDPVSLDQMILSFSHWFQGQTAEEVLEGMTNQMRNLQYRVLSMQNENKEEFAQAVLLAKRSIHQLSGSFLKLRDLFADINQSYTKNKKKGNSLKDSLNNMIAVSDALSKMRTSFSKGRGNMGKFVKEKRFYKELNAAAYFAKVFFRCIREHPVVLIYRQPCPEN